MALKGRPFVKGDSRINRGGRPRVPDYVRKAFDEMLPEALASLREDLNDEDPQVRHVARMTVFNYRLGKEQLPPEEDEALEATAEVVQLEKPEPDSKQLAATLAVLGSVGKLPQLVPVGSAGGRADAAPPEVRSAPAAPDAARIPPAE